MNRTEPKPETKLTLTLSAAERKLLDDLPVNEGAVAAIQQTTKRNIPLSVIQLDNLADALSVKANNTGARVLQRRLDTLVRQIDRLTGDHLLTLLESEVTDAQSAGSQKPK